MQTEISTFLIAKEGAREGVRRGVDYGVLNLPASGQVETAFLWWVRKYTLFSNTLGDI